MAIDKKMCSAIWDTFSGVHTFSKYMSVKQCVLHMRLHLFVLMKNTEFIADS